MARFSRLVKPASLELVRLEVLRDGETLTLDGGLSWPLV